MDTHRDDTTPTDRIAGWLQATRAELIGLAVLLVGALVATGLLWLQATGRPVPGALGAPAAPVVELGAPVDGAGDRETDGADGEATMPDEVTVHVTGAVARPGVVTLPGGARVADALEAAGGADGDAALERLNLARVLDDGEHVHLPTPDEDPPAPVDGSASSGGVLPDGRVDLNRASQSDLETLPGIGPAKAAAIIEHRDSVGGFAVAGDLRDVPGIGEATFQRLADQLVVR